VPAATFRPFAASCRCTPPAKHCTAISFLYSAALNVEPLLAKGRQYPPLTSTPIRRTAAGLHLHPKLLKNTARGRE
jgi:hypothetical protein